MRLPKPKGDTFTGNAVLIFLSRFFPTLANTLVLIFFSRQLEMEYYGAYQNFWVQLILLSTLGGLGLQSFLFVYTPDVLSAIIKSLKAKHYIWLGIWLLILGGVFAWLQHSTVPVVIAVSFLFVYALTVITESILLAYRNLTNIVWLNIAHTAVFILLHYLFLKGAYSMNWLFAYLLMLYTVKLMLCTIMTYISVAKASRKDTEMDIAPIRKLWLHMGLYDVLQIVFKYIDKFIISIFLTESLSAIYYNGSQDVPFLPILLGAVGGAALMQLSADKAEDAPLVVMNKTARILSTVVFPVFFFLVFFRYEVFDVVLVKYTSSVPIFLMSVLVLPLRACNFTVVLQNKHKGDLINTGAIIDMIIACALMYPLYILMGLPGVAFSFVISTYIQAGYYLHHTAKLLNVSWMKLIPVRNWALKLIIYSIVFIGIHYVLSRYFTQEIVLLWGIICTAVVVLLAFIMEFRAVKRIYGNA